MKKKRGNVGFISTRLSGMDGVSLESAKWEAVFEREGFTCFYMAGELDRPPERSFLVEDAHFTHPEIQKIQEGCFGVSTRKHSVTKKIHQIKELLEEWRNNRKGIQWTDEKENLFRGAIDNLLKKGNKLQWSGFGTFSVSKRNARLGINPVTKERINLPEMRVPKFKAGKQLKEIVKFS